MPKSSSQQSCRNVELVVLQIFANYSANFKYVLFFLHKNHAYITSANEYILMSEKMFNFPSENV